MDDDDKMPRARGGRPTRRRAIAAIATVACVLAVALAVGGAVVAFRHASHHLHAVRRDTAASAGRVASLTAALAQASTARDRSRHEAAVAHAALEAARSAHLRGEAALRAELADLDTTRREAYASLVDANARTAQLAALHTCLDGVSQALDMLGAGDVHGWQNRLRSIDGVCKQAQAATA